MEVPIVRPTILVADDDPTVRELVTLLLQKEYDVLLAEDGGAALEVLKEKPVDLVLMDVAMQPMNGLEALERLKEQGEDLPVIMLTASQSITDAVHAMKLGAFDYVTKPYEPDELKLIIKRAFEKQTLLKENLFYRSEQNHTSPRFKQMVGQSAVMQDVFRMIQDVSKSSATVLITGESGTGKELVARAIHELSERSDKLFVAVNCAAIPESLLESTLFGHEKGAFTSADRRMIGKFEFANGGTLFLDEISSMTMPLQAKLLRVIQERSLERIGGNKLIPVDIRVVSATNVDLSDAVNRDEFRKDLFYRLNVVPVHLPPLRERKEDLPLLLSHFVEKYNREFGKRIKGFTKEAESLLYAYHWPGNIRELENFVERLVVLGRSEMIEVDQIPQPISGVSFGEPHPDEANGRGGHAPSMVGDLERMEAEFIRKALLKTRGNKKKAAELLGMHRNTLRKKLSDMASRGLTLE